MCVDVVGDLLPVTVGTNRQDWPEDFPRHDLHFLGGFEHQMRREFALLRVRLLARGEIDQRRAFALCVGQGVLQPGKGARVDDRRVVRAVDVRIALGNQAPAMIGEFVFLALGQKDVINIGANLSRVEHLHPHNPFGRRLDGVVGPDVPDPVNRMWSNGIDEKAGPRPPPSSKNLSLSSPKYFGLMRASKIARLREFSDILTMARFPAAKIAVSGAKVRLIGKFQGTMMPTTPSGCGRTRLWAPGYVRKSILRRCGFIHFFRCLQASWMPSNTTKYSAN